MIPGTYEDYLKSAAWREKLAVILARDHHRCRNCRGRATEVHHASYRRLGREAPDDLVSLCRWCHLETHGITIPDPPIPTM
jgi:hypothetical protein